ncbi:hypothetical protein ACJX0J_024639, partial [Zea mays]
THATTLRGWYTIVLNDKGFLLTLNNNTTPVPLVSGEPFCDFFFILTTGLYSFIFLYIHLGLIFLIGVEFCFKLPGGFINFGSVCVIGIHIGVEYCFKLPGVFINFGTVCVIGIHYLSIIINNPAFIRYLFA